MIELYLPVAAGIFWHPESPLREEAAPSFAFNAFDNIMHLAQAALICYKDTMSIQRANRFRDHYARFVETLTSKPLACYGEQLVPNIHEAFHIYELGHTLFAL
jgi:hypothetical protein